MQENNWMTVGELAKKMNVTVRTLQYYDKEGVLKPSCQSEGGRRMYNKKDMVELHQILSLKFLGFSLEEIKENITKLESASDVLITLARQKSVIKRKIEELSQAMAAIQALENEVQRMNKVDFNKYADIIQLLRMDNQGYWVVQAMDDTLLEHIKSNYNVELDPSDNLYEVWLSLCDKIAIIKDQGYAPESPEGQKAAKEWWDMVIEFTRGDMNLINNLSWFEQNRDNWDENALQKYQYIEEFMGRALADYWIQENIQLPEMED